MARVLHVVPRKEKKITCEACGHRIAYVDNDVKRHDGTDYGGGPDGREWIDCPNEACRKMITIRTW